jgi:peptidoglycan/xylan/chitin deacetylase (PgdA/CDA1 family)
VVKSPLRKQIRAGVRYGVLSALAKVSTRLTRRSLATKRVQNLYFHFLPESDIDNFLSLVRVLAKDHVFISYSEAVWRVENDAIDKPYLSISFDDGFQSNLRAGELLAQEGISACFFVCPNMVGKDRQALQRDFIGDIGDETRMMKWSEIKQLIQLGHEIGSHTLDHKTLSQLPHYEAHHQIVRSKEILETELGTIKHFAWPNGRFHHFAPELIDSVTQAGYKSSASAERGAHLTGVKMSNGCIRRENCEARWPISHTLYLLGRSVRKSDTSTGKWPREWQRAL